MSHTDTIRYVRLAAETAEEKKGENIIGLDVRGQSSLTDYFLFISGTSHVHIRAIEDAIRAALKENGAALSRTDGQRGHLWRALDYGTLIIHVMDKKTREFYAMERLWERARRLDFSPAPAPVLPKAAPRRKPAKKPVKKSPKRAPVKKARKK